MRESLFETLVGLAVVAVAAVFLVFSLQQGSSAAPSDSYSLSANFSRVDGVSQGSDVRLAGVKVGVVTKVALDPETYQAVVSFSVPSDVRIPDDSTAQIASDGLLGGAYLSLIVGGSFDYLEPGGRVEFTRGSLDLLSVLSQFAPSGASSGPAASPPAPATGEGGAAGADQ
ncbi:outer membrane lipid asymmetry maintenance protein MlaD [bacterium]|nr:outer membrane lipid asymmetry maintenance protein MlaD [bacterium]